MTSRRAAPGAALAAVGLAALPLLAAGVVPMYSGTSSDGGSVHATLVQEDGVRVLLVLTIPLAITVVALIFVRSNAARPVLAITCALLWGWTIVTGFTVGFLYLPAAIALLVALGTLPPRRAAAPVAWPPPQLS